MYNEMISGGASRVRILISNGVKNERRVLGTEKLSEEIQLKLILAFLPFKIHIL